MIVSEALFERYPDDDEGSLTTRRAVDRRRTNTISSTTAPTSTSRITKPPAAEPLGAATANERAGREATYLAGLDAALAGTAAPSAPGAGAARA